MEPFKLKRPAAKAARWKEAQKFGPTLSLYTREDGANQNYLYFVLKSYKDGTEANMDVEGEEGTGKGGFISFLQGPKEENNISGQITAGQQPAGYYPLFLDTCFDPERGIAISGGFASFILWVFAYDFDRREAVLLNRDRQIVLSPTELGEIVVKSHLKEVGKLDYLNVGGNVVIDAGLTVNGGMYTTSIFADTYLNLPPLDPNQLTPLTLDAANFRVGISNPLPQHALDVAGDVNVSGQFLVNGQPVTTDLTPITLDPANDRVGINKTTPGSALDVVGDGKFTGVLEAEGMALRDAGLLVAGRSILRQTDILSNLEVAGNTTLAGNLDVEGAVGIASDLSVIGNTFLFNADVIDKVKAYKFFSGDISIVGGVGNPNGVETADAGSLFMSSSGVLYVKTGTGNTGWVALGSGVTPTDLLPITLDKPNNRVGINNATPAYTLGVGGDANLSTGGTYRISTFPVVAAGATNTTIALGRTDTVPDTSTNAVAIGYAANVGPSSVAIGNSAGKTTQGSSSVAIGAGAGTTSQGSNSVSVGVNSGQNTQSGSSVAIGVNAGRYTQGASSVAIGSAAGTGNTTPGTGQGSNAVAIGVLAGSDTQGAYSVAVGNQSGQTTQGISAVAVGHNAGNSAQAPRCVAIGEGSGMTNQKDRSVSIGFGAGSSEQNTLSVAIGSEAGRHNQGSSAVAIGSLAGAGTTTAGTGQGTNAVAVGSNAGQNTQGVSATAVGVNAGQTSQGSNAVAVGNSAGQTNQHYNSIILNASGVPLNSDGSFRFYVKPIRQNTTATNRLGYDPTTGEITYADVAPAPNITSTIVTSPNYGSNTDFSFDVLLPQPGLYQIHVDHAHKFISAYTVTTRYMIVIYGGVLTDTGVLNSKAFSKINDICEIPLGTYAINNKTVGTSATFFSIAVASYGTFTINCQVQNPNNIPVNTFETTRRVTVMKLV